VVHGGGAKERGEMLSHDGVEHGVLRRARPVELRRRRRRRRCRSHADVFRESGGARETTSSESVSIATRTVNHPPAEPGEFECGSRSKRHEKNTQEDTLGPAPPAYSRNCQTSVASPAEPGGLQYWPRERSVRGSRATLSWARGGTTPKQQTTATTTAIRGIHGTAARRGFRSIADLGSTLPLPASRRRRSARVAGCASACEVSGATRSRRRRRRGRCRPAAAARECRAPGR